MATLAPTLAGCSADLATQHARFLCSGAGAVDYDTGAPLNASGATAEDQTDVVIVTGTALNRLPGVSMFVEKGEGRYVQIRGVASNLNNVTINGAQKRFYLTPCCPVLRRDHRVRRTYRQAATLLGERWR